ncbi:patatin-like phospholipase family protein [Mariprofundus sp. EBB-1]|uniref:patatin-like phospholipase family protein n=1 Tax=Mariprofundus sp. EBB-1 TaxID=2650971 RepID=UPI000EF2420C|nr:patatin-like phospholipase family protein [Mariprofundus sp. EBB-1]RLL51751.1 patatin-like phospholipase family protein [Mariprofundus sp. EBB-1]
MNLLERITAARRVKKNGFILALGGGGGRGLAHLGVLDVLEAHHLKPDAIIGSSIGALFGSMYAVNPDAKAVIARAQTILASEHFTNLSLPAVDEPDRNDKNWFTKLSTAARQTVLLARASTGLSIADTTALIDIAHEFCGESCFNDTDIPMYITAVEFPNGECHLFSANSDIKLPCAIAASMAIPGVFDPVGINNKKYVDGGLGSDIPAQEARMLAAPDQLVLAVNVGARPVKDIEPGNVYEMLDWATQIKSLYLRKYNKDFADVLIEPLVGFTQWNDFSHPEQEIEMGRQAALEKMPELMDKLGIG